MFIQTEPTPNPATVKFIPGQEILKSGTMDFATKEDASASPLALRLFSLEGVERVFLATDFISVSKDNNTDWSFLKSMVLAAIMEHLSTGQPIIDETKIKKTDQNKPSDLDDKITGQIKELLDTRVRPMVAMDGGDIIFDSFEDGIVYLELRGACSGCPSSTATLKSGIENMLKHFIPEVVEVRPVNY